MEIKEEGVLTRANLYKLSKEQLERIARAQLTPDSRRLAPLTLRCRAYCHDKIPGWSQALTNVQNGVYRVVRKAGVYDAQQIAAIVSCVEGARLAELTGVGDPKKGQLKESEFEALTHTAYGVLSEVAEDPEAVNVWRVPVGAAESQGETLEEIGVAEPMEPEEELQRPSESVAPALEVIVYEGDDIVKDARDQLGLDIADAVAELEEDDEWLTL